MRGFGRARFYGSFAHGGLVLAFGLAVGAIGSGCAHPIAFNAADTSWHYSVGAEKLGDAALVAVIDPATAAQSYTFRAWASGVANQWVVNYGEMLVQVADVELPQLVGLYERSTSFREPASGNPRLTLVLTVPSYVFEDYRAKLTLRAEAFGPGRKPIFSKDYSAMGESEAGMMVGLGALGQTSAVRQSSLDAFKAAFAAMRPDLLAALRGGAAR
jgi:hypothetical protein